MRSGDPMHYSMDLKFAYKGERNYLHGTDIYNAVTKIIGEKECIDFNKIKMAFHKVIRNQCQLVFGDISILGPIPENISFEVNLISLSAGIAGWLIETEEKVTSRVPYPEEEIVKKCTFEGKRITIEGETPFTPIEILVAMTKELHANLYPVKAGKWFFTKLELNRLLATTDSCRFKVEGEQNLCNRLTRSRIYSGEELLGDIFYSLVKE